MSLMYKILFIVLIYVILSGCIEKTWQSTSNLPRETIVALEKEERVVKIIVFHDFNGNGRKEDFEPPLADTTIKSDTGEIYFTNTSGCVKIKTKQYVIIIPKNRTFRYVTWSTKLVEYLEGNLKVTVNKNKIEVPLAQGFLTFPLKSDTFSLWRVSSKGNSEIPCWYRFPRHRG